MTDKTTRDQLGPQGAPTALERAREAALEYMPSYINRGRAARVVASGTTFFDHECTPLHDYPLVPGDEVRKLREELESVREACRVAVAQQAKEDDEVEELRADVAKYRTQLECALKLIDQARREGFEAARESGDVVILPESGTRIQPYRYLRFADYGRTLGEDDMIGDGESNG